MTLKSSTGSIRRRQARVRKSTLLMNRTGSVRLRLKDVSASEIATALSTSARPFQRVKLAGAISGSVEARWRGSVAKAETAVGLEVVAPAQLRTGDLPLNAHVRAQLPFRFRRVAGRRSLTPPRGPRKFTPRVRFLQAPH